MSMYTSQVLSNGHQDNVSERVRDIFKDLSSTLDKISTKTAAKQETGKMADYHAYYDYSHPSSPGERSTMHSETSTPERSYRKQEMDSPREEQHQQPKTKKRVWFNEQENVIHYPHGNNPCPHIPEKKPKSLKSFPKGVILDDSRRNHIPSNSTPSPYNYSRPHSSSLNSRPRSIGPTNKVQHYSPVQPNLNNRHTYFDSYYQPSRPSSHSGSLKSSMESK
mmetsp:Transcript_28245/g.25045  ORF Transcript_28245/g.25045 Transcript_28245/m.25045 type:complete len:221 (-) Transcript_28245:721-1383(-)